MYLKDEAIKYLIEVTGIWQFEVTFHICLDIGRDDHDDYDDRESSDKDYHE